MYRESLQIPIANGSMSKRLATIDTTVPIHFGWKTWRQAPDIGALKGTFKELEFFSLMEALGPGRGHAPARLRHARYRERRGRIRGGDSGGRARGSLGGLLRA